MPRVVRKNDDDTVDIGRVEPLNWWVGMAEPTLTLTIWGRNVALTRPSVRGEGVRLLASHATDSANYLFVDIAIAADARPGSFFVDLSLGGEVVASMPYELRQRKQGSAERRGLTGADIVYLAMPDRFASAPAGEDSAPTREKPDRRRPYGRHGGNLRGIMAHTDYLHALGVTALWLTPVMTSDMDSQSYHGYATTDYYGVDPRLGTLADYRLLSASLGQWGIRLVMDMVLNHCGTRHPWMADAPGSQWFNSWEWKPELTNYAPGVATDIHASAYDRRRTVEGWFDVTMADLNMGNPMVRTYLAQAAIWWVETADLGGLRIDTFPYADREGMNWWVERVLREYPSLSVVGETWVGSPALLAAWQRGGERDGEQASSLRTIMDFPLQEAIVRSFTEDFGYGTGAGRLYAAIAADRVYARPDDMMVFGDNHDTGRMLSRFGGDTQALRLALAFILTTRGIPQIYYGTEMLMEGDSDRGHAEIRRDMPGGWDGDKEDWFALATSDTADGKPRDEARRQTFQFVAKLVALRKKSRALAYGRLVHFLPTDNTYVFFRVADNGERVMVVLNLCHKAVSLNMERFAEIAGTTLSGRDALSGKQFSAATRIRVGARTPMVIELGIPLPTSPNTTRGL